MRAWAEIACSGPYSKAQVRQRSSRRISSNEIFRDVPPLMAMQSQTYTISGLSVELGHDRRSLSRWLDTLPPAEIDEQGNKRWRIRDVVDHINAQTSGDGLSDVRKEYAFWVGEMLYPALFSGKNVVSIFTGGLRDELGLSKAQTLRAYQILCLAVGTELLESLPGIRLRVPSLIEQIHKKGIETVVAELWPDDKPGVAP
jgi:hypothetical protein